MARADTEITVCIHYTHISSHVPTKYVGIRSEGSSDHIIRQKNALLTTPLALYWSTAFDWVNIPYRDSKTCWNFDVIHPCMWPKVENSAGK
jgi:hypothetical protein